MPLVDRARALALASFVVNAVALSWTSAAIADDPAAGCTTTDDGQQTCVFAYTGAPQTWTVPQGVTSSSFYVAGAQGGAAGGARGGFGGWVFADASLTPGTVMQVNVGGHGADAPDGGAGGWNGGGVGYNLAGGGGGASDVRQGACAALSTCAMADRVIVGGAGGGSAGIDTLQEAHYGGEGGGGQWGGNAYPYSTSTYNGGGGKLAYAGSGGQSLCASGSSSPGGTGVGGAGNPACSGGGGGGAGYYGGGGGGSSNSATYPGGFAGGGGTAFVGGGLSNPHYSDLDPAHVRSGDGIVIIVSPVKAPIITMAFGKPVVDLLENVTLTFTFTNPNPRAPLTNVVLLDSYPAGMTNVSPDDLYHDCNGAAISAPLGAGYLTFVGGTIPAGGVCTVVRIVRGTQRGTFLNTTGTVTSDQLPGNTASASLQVGANASSLPPTASMSFSQSSADIGQDVTLTVTLANPNPDVSLDVYFNDSFPYGLYTVTSVKTPACDTGALTSQDSSLYMTQERIPPGGTCTFSGLVQGFAAGDYVNTADPVTAAWGVGNGNAASARLAVLNPGDHIFSANMETPP